MFCSPFPAAMALDQFHRLLLGAEEMFGQVVLDLEPFDASSRLVHLFFFRRSLNGSQNIVRYFLTGCVLGMLFVLAAPGLRSKAYLGDRVKNTQVFQTLPARSTRGRMTREANPRSN